MDVARHICVFHLAGAGGVLPVAGTLVAAGAAGWKWLLLGATPAVRVGRAAGPALPKRCG
eukprot:COSAG02_NODE_222_length_28382_cov_82.417601_20_plen_60_part_00